ncbi:membrane protein [Sulfurifustis variabilis]|uniref:Membrane protein n=1 Tax=Sulfurifustis variabilis TaxID=1675686 RepID=A0A1B4VGU7_9GAMM|nr:hypothetical protein [Sulfurifustis variabilis]BAU50087.1 membrane protein [Sulfurifustis variabilis]
MTAELGWRKALDGHFPPWIKVPYTVFVGLLVPVYWVAHGPANFLWFSDVALFGVLIVLWFEHRLLASMMALGVLLPELAWNVGFFGKLLTGTDVVGLAGYMFDPSIPLAVRGLSLFHVFLPPLLLWTVYRLGYDERALRAQTLLAWAVLPASALVATPENNVNWALGWGDHVPQPWMPGWLWVGFLMAAFPLVVYLPTDRLLRKWPGPRPGREDGPSRSPPR